MTRDDLPTPRPPRGERPVAKGGPVLGRRRLARDLRARRLRAMRTINEVADHLECSPAKISRLETGAVGVRVQDLRELIELYDVPAGEREELYALVRLSRQRGWWHEYSDVYPLGSETLYDLEDGAAGIRIHSPSLVPGLLQTERYARALISSATQNSDLVERRVALRRRRQELMHRPDPPLMRVLIDEAVLCHVIGSPGIMAEQLASLCDATSGNRVVVQVIEFDAAVHAGAGVAFTLFDFDIPTLAATGYQEQLCGNAYVDDADCLQVFEATWQAALAAAADPRRSRERIATYLNRLHERPHRPSSAAG